MLFVLAQVQGARYAIPARRVVEMIPMVEVVRMPNLRVGLAGLLQYHGSSVWVFDLALLTAGGPSPALMSTRIALLDLGQAGRVHRLVGLVAERATQMVRIPPDRFGSDEAGLSEIPYLGPIAITPQGPIRRVEVDGFASLLSQTSERTGVAP